MGPPHAQVKIRRVSDFYRKCRGRGQKFLSVVHTTDLFRLSEIQDDNRLEPAEDKYFKGERLLYFFYGRPSYRVNSQVQNTRVSAFAPICFVFKKNFRCPTKRIYPFDTGAFFAGRMKTKIHPNFELDDFLLDAETVSAQSVVSKFYNSNEDYLDCRPSDNLKIDDLVTKRLHRVESYYQLIRDVGNDGSDERIHSIELQVENNIELRGNLLAVVVPARFFTDEQISEMITAWDCKIVGYHVKSLFTPTDLMSLLFDKVREVMLDDGQIP